MKHIIVALGGLCLTAAAVAKLPPPTPEQQAAAALNAAKAAHAAKVDAYTLCLSQTKVAETYIKEQKTAGKVYTPEATPACVNPGPFVPPSPAPVAAAASAPAPAQPAAPAAAAKPAAAAPKK